MEDSEPFKMTREFHPSSALAAFHLFSPLA
jgi:hypothetical protein